jgi:hypothetical protein
MEARKPSEKPESQWVIIRHKAEKRVALWGGPSHDYFRKPNGAVRHFASPESASRFASKLDAKAAKADPSHD